MRVMFSRLFIGLLLTGLSVSCVVAQEKKQQVAEELPSRIEPDQAKWYAHYKKQANAPNPDDQLLNKDSEPKIKDGFVDLFNGKDLTGWTPKGGKCKFEVVDGVIVGTCVPKTNSTYLCTDRDDYKDFIFTCEVKWEIDGNTCLLYTSPSPRD